MPMQTFATKFVSPESYLNFIPGMQCTPVTPSDTVDLPSVPGMAVIGIYSAAGGTVAFNIYGASTPTGTITLPAAVPVLLGAKRVLATGTNATGLLALYATI